MQWSWEVEPYGVLKLMGPLIGHIGRRQEQRAWASLKSHLEANPVLAGMA